VIDSLVARSYQPWFHISTPGILLPITGHG
jgi:hypothetical protein